MDAVKNSYINIIASVLNDPNGVKMPTPIGENFDKCLIHINGLLDSAVILCKHNHFSEALFLAITAVEESVKAEMYLFRSKNSSDGIPSKDKLKSHEIKHKAAVNKDVLLIGKRVQDVIGEELTERIYTEFTKSKTRELRESCIYFEVKDAMLILPENEISPQMALSYILACIEIIDDKLVGLTNYSMELSSLFDNYFNTINEIFKDYNLLNNKSL